MATPEGEAASAILVEMVAILYRTVRHYRGGVLIPDPDERAALLARLVELTALSHAIADRAEPLLWDAEDWLRFRLLHDQHAAAVAEIHALRLAMDSIYPDSPED